MKVEKVHNAGKAMQVRLAVKNIDLETCYKALYKHEWNVEATIKYLKSKEV